MVEGRAARRPPKIILPNSLEIPLPPGREAKDLPVVMLPLHTMRCVDASISSQKQVICARTVSEENADATMGPPDGTIG